MYELKEFSSQEEREAYFYRPTTEQQKSKASDKQVGGQHYKSMVIQPGHFIRANDIGWYEGNAIKYICRHKAKNGIQDIEKAIHYLELVLEEYNNQ